MFCILTLLRYLGYLLQLKTTQKRVKSQPKIYSMSYPYLHTDIKQKTAVTIIHYEITTTAVDVISVD